MPRYKVTFKKVMVITWEGDAADEAEAVNLAEEWARTRQGAEIYKAREVVEVPPP